jgi:hypothetical protein
MEEVFQILMNMKRENLIKIININITEVLCAMYELNIHDEFTVEKQDIIKTMKNIRQYIEQYI